MSSHAESIPRGAYAPRSCFAMRTSADEKTIFAIHIRTSGQERRASARRGNETLTRSTKSGGLAGGSLCVQRTTPPRAAGVSPPWFENRTCADNSAHIPTRPSHAAPRAAGVSPPWVCKPSPQRQCDEFRRFEFASAMHPTAPLGFGAFTWSAPRMMSSHAESIPRGAYAPRSCFAMRTSADEKTIFAIHIRTSGQERQASARRGNETLLQDGSLCVQRTTPPRAAGVSPPWVCKPRLQLQCDEFRRFEFASAMHPTGAYAFGAFTWSPPRPMSSHAESIPRGAYAPRSCFAMRTSADEKTIFAIHIRTSGQERRASARRGWVIRTRYRTKRALFTY
jgi:hypothetical protein